MSGPSTTGRPVLIDELSDFIVDQAKGSQGPRQAAAKVLERFPAVSILELAAAAVELARDGADF
jgi:hypothetical protein